MDKKLQNTLVEEILRARERIYQVNQPTPLEEIALDEVDAQVWLKREDLSAINAYKWRGAYNAICMLSEEERKKPILAASAGNHAQGVALAARILGLKAKIYMPTSTPRMKQVSVQRHGQEHVQIVLKGDTYNQAAEAAYSEAEKKGCALIHPFDNLYTIAGQATIADEMVLSGKGPFDYAFLQIGGGGLAAGVATWLRIHYPGIKIIGVEGEGQACMKAAIEAKKLVELDEVDGFCDGTAVRQAGALTYDICKDTLDEVITVSNEEVCAAIETMWECRRVTPEPSGAMGLAGLVKYAKDHGKEIKGKKIMTLISGANMDFSKLRLISASYAVGSHRQKFLCFEIDERGGSLLGLIQKYFGDVNVTAFQYGKVSETRAWPVISFEADPETLTRITKQLDKDKVPYTDITGEADTRYRVINYNPALFHHPLFFHVHFPERSGALRELLKRISPVANVCYFNYVYTGETIGRAIMGFEFDKPEKQKKFMDVVEQSSVTCRPMEDGALKRMIFAE